MMDENYWDSLMATEPKTKQIEKVPEVPEVEVITEVQEVKETKKSMKDILGSNFFEVHPDSKVDFASYQQEEFYDDPKKGKKQAFFELEKVEKKGKNGKYTITKLVDVKTAVIAYIISKEFRPFTIPTLDPNAIYLYREDEGIFLLEGQTGSSEELPLYLEDIIFSFIPTMIASKKGRKPIKDIKCFLFCQKGSKKILNEIYKPGKDDWVVFNNGVMNIKTLETKPHDTEDVRINKVYIDMPDLTDPNIDEKVKESVYYEFFIGILNYSQLIEVSAMMALGCMTKTIRKTLILLGETQIGKTTVIDIFGFNALRESYVKFITSQVLGEKNKFETIRLAGKTLACGSEIDKGDLKDTAFAKNFLDCADAIGSKKFKDVIEFPRSDTIFITTNVLPKNTSDLSGALEDRLSIIRCQKNENYHKIPDFEKRLAQEKDISLWLTFGFKNLREAGLKDPTLSNLQCKESIEEVERYKAKGNHIKEFLSSGEYLIKAPKGQEKEYKILRSIVYTLYETFCDNEDIPMNLRKRKSDLFDEIRDAEGISEKRTNAGFYFYGIASPGDERIKKQDDTDYLLDDDDDVPFN